MTAQATFAAPVRLVGVVDGWAINEQTGDAEVVIRGTLEEITSLGRRLLHDGSIRLSPPRPV